MDGSNLGFLPGAVIAGETIYVAAANTINDWAGNDIIIPGITPAGGYTLAYSFSAATPITVNAVANGDNTGWTLTVTAAQTLLWRAGIIRYTALAVLADPARSYAVDSGAIKVTASPLTVSQYQAALTAVEAAIASYGSSNTRSIQQGDMSITFNSLKELLDLREFYRGEIARETSSRQKRIIRSRFT